MKIKLKWLLLGSLMCIGVGSGFQSSYGMKNDDEEISWEQTAIKDCSKDELQKVEKKFFTYKQIVEGQKYWNYFNKIKESKDIPNKDKLTLVKDAADQGSAVAILYLLEAYRYGSYGLQKEDSKGLVLAQKYADQGSKVAIIHLLNAYRCGYYGLQKEDSKGLKLAIKYAKKGSEKAIHFLNENK